MEGKKCNVKYATRNETSKNFARADARGLQTPVGPATLGPSQILPGRIFRPSPPLAESFAYDTVQRYQFNAI